MGVVFDLNGKPRKAAAAGTEPYGLDPAFERAVVALACRNPTFYAQIAHEIDTTLLGSAEAKLLMDALHAMAAESGGRTPTASVVVLQRARRLVHEGKVKAKHVEACVEYLELADEAGLPDAESAAAELVVVLRRRVQSALVTAAMDEYARRGDFRETRILLDKSESLGVVTNSVGTRMDPAALDELAALRSMERLPTGIVDLDFSHDSKLARGCLGMMVGAPGAGKSMFLSQIAANAAMSGMLVLYATLELPVPLVMARMFAHVAGIPIAEIEDGTRDREAREAWASRVTIGSGYVRFFTAQATQVRDITKWFDACEAAAGRQPDLLIVDYADKLIDKATRKDGKYAEMLPVYEGLRLFAHERKIWCWTASQATRNSRGAKNMDLDQVADSMHKGRVADLVLTGAVDEEDHGAQVKLFVAKNRWGRGRYTVGPLRCDFECGRIAEP